MELIQFVSEKSYHRAAVDTQRSRGEGWDARGNKAWIKVFFIILRFSSEMSYENFTASAVRFQQCKSVSVSIASKSWQTVLWVEKIIELGIWVVKTRENQFWQPTGLIGISHTTLMCILQFGEIY